MTQEKRRGRPRRFCSGRCRVAHFRYRKRNGNVIPTSSLEKCNNNQEGESLISPAEKLPNTTCPTLEEWWEICMGTPPRPSTKRTEMLRALRQRGVPYPGLAQNLAGGKND